jgi:hypothetical protein
MPIDLDTRAAPGPKTKPSLELPPLVRDYFEYVRGNPEISNRVPFDYLDRLWSQAKEFAKHNGIDCPIHREEVEALRGVVEARMAAAPATLSEEESERRYRGNHSF